MKTQEVGEGGRAEEVRSDITDVGRCPTLGGLNIGPPPLSRVGLSDPLQSLRPHSACTPAKSWPVRTSTRSRLGKYKIQRGSRGTRIWLVSEE